MANAAEAEQDNENYDLDTLLDGVNGGNDEIFLGELNEAYIKNIQSSLDTLKTKPIYANGIMSEMLQPTDPTTVLLES